MKRTIIILITLITFSASSLASIMLDRVVAIVDREIITWSELYKAMSFDYESEMRGMDTEERDNFLRERQSISLERLIVLKLQIAEAKKNGINVTEQEVNAALANTRGQFKMSEDEFRQAVRDQGFGYDEYVDRIRERVLIQKAVHFMITSKIIVTEDEIDDFLRENEGDLAMDRLYRFRQIKLLVPRGGADLEAAEAFIGNVYDDLESGGDFVEIMERVKNDPMVDFVIDTDLIKETDLRDDITKHIRGLSDGETAKPLYADDGIYIIQLVKTQLPENLEEVRDNIRKLLVNNKTEQRFKTWARDLRQNALIEILL